MTVIVPGFPSEVPVPLSDRPARADFRPAPRERARPGVGVDDVVKLGTPVRVGLEGRTGYRRGMNGDEW